MTEASKVMSAEQYFVYDNRDASSKGPFDRKEAMVLCGKLNDEVEMSMTKEEKKAKPNQRDRRPFTFGTKNDFYSYGKIVIAR